MFDFLQEALDITGMHKALNQSAAALFMKNDFPGGICAPKAGGTGMKVADDTIVIRHGMNCTIG